MSGGHYGYLGPRSYCIDITDALAKPELQDMARRLHQVAPGHPVTAWTLALAAMQHQPVPQTVGDVWHAVEWCDSGDTSDADMLAALDATRDWTPTPGTDHAALGVAVAALRAEITHAHALLDRIEAHQ